MSKSKNRLSKGEIKTGLTELSGNEDENFINDPVVKNSNEKEPVRSQIEVVEEASVNLDDKEEIKRITLKDTLKHLISLSPNYFLLTIVILLPFVLGVSIVVFYLAPLKYNLYFLIPLFMVLLVYCPFKGINYYFNVIQKLRRSKEDKFYFSQRTLNHFSDFCQKIKYSGFKFSIGLYIIFYFIVFSSSVPIIYIILLVSMDFLYYGIFIIRHDSKGEISTPSRQLFTGITIISLFPSCMVLGAIGNIKIITIIIPAIIAVSYVVYKSHLIVPKFLSWCRNTLYQLADKTKILRIREKILDFIEKRNIQLPKIRIIKHRKLLIKCGILLGFLVAIIYTNKFLTFNPNTISNISRFFRLHIHSGRGLGGLLYQ